MLKLTHKGYWLCFHQKHSKTSILKQVPNLRKKKHFWTHVTIGSCSALVWKDLKKIQKFPPCRLQDISVWIDKNPFIGPTKNMAATIHKVTFVWINIHIGGASLGSFFKANWLYDWNHLELYNTTYRKKILAGKK